MREDRADVVVYCVEQSHEGKRAKVQTFHLVTVDEDDGPRWRLRGDGAQLLDGDNPLAEPTLTLPGDPAQRVGARQRWALECPLCGLRKDVRRQTIEPVLIRCADSGVFELSLADVAARL